MCNTYLYIDISIFSSNTCSFKYGRENSSECSFLPLWRSVYMPSMEVQECPGTVGSHTQTDIFPNHLEELCQVRLLRYCLLKNYAFAYNVRIPYF